MPRKLVPERHVRAMFTAPSPASRTVEAWQAVAADVTLRKQLELPASLLSEYFRERGRSRLGRIVNTANRLAETCETVVLIGPRGATAAARAMFAALAHPFYPRLSHGGRGGRPQIVFLEPTLDNDLLQGVLDLLKSTDDGPAPGDRWALAVAEPTATTTADEVRDFIVLRDMLVAVLREGAASPEAAELRSFRLGDAADASLPALHGAAFFDGPALFTAALVGSDTVALCKGATWFHEDAKQALPDECEAVRPADVVAGGPTQLVAWHHALEPLARRFAAMLREGAPPVEPHVTVVAGYDPVARRRLLGDRAARRIHLVAEVVRRDRLEVPSPLAAAYEEVRSAEAATECRGHEIRLTRLGDQALGELCAWFAAAIVIVKSQA